VLASLDWLTGIIGDYGHATRAPESRVDAATREKNHAKKNSEPPRLGGVHDERCVEYKSVESHLVSGLLMEKTRVLWLCLVAALDEFAGETKKDGGRRHGG
jgi:hypothetical protein